MKQVVADFSTGECQVREVPPPVVGEGGVLVRNRWSLISTGTEGGTVKLGRMSLLGKARARPEQARKVLAVARTQGLLVAYNAARRALEMPIVLGYCCAGEVIAVGAGVTDLAVGDLVACGGPGHANHAEIVAVPRNLCVPVPAGLDARAAAFTTLGAVALQAVRIADARLGENVVVIGLGLVGLLAVELLRAAGCRVFGIDRDPLRARFVADRGWGATAGSTDANIAERVQAWAGGEGADSVIVTAATDDNAPVALAGLLARRKGRVVVVGRTEMSAPRDTYLFKELELHTSMAYGPGTGDPAYEELGIDYPYAYVRWTENRNMAAFLDQAAAGRLDLEALVTHEFGVDDAARAFDLASGRTPERSTAILLRYPAADGAPAAAPAPLVRLPARATAPAAGALTCSVIGAGSYATNEFLPLLAKVPGVRLRGIASATGVRAQALGARHGFELCTADVDALIADPGTDCVFILTRHDTHARLAAAALALGRHVFVEKPLALTPAELDRVEAAWRASGRALMVGFNRRHAPLAARMKAFFGTRAQPASILYRANVGYRPPGHWLHDPRQGGGVILGEACHHVDFCQWLVGAPAVSADVLALAGPGLVPGDNVHMRVGYADGSVATLAYLSNGPRAFPIEQVEVSCDNRAAVLTDYRRLELGHGLSVRRARHWLGPDRGHAAQIEAFLAAVRGGAPVDTAGQLASSRTTLALAAAAGSALAAPPPQTA